MCCCQHPDSQALFLMLKCPLNPVLWYKRGLYSPLGASGFGKQLKLQIIDIHALTKTI